MEDSVLNFLNYEGLEYYDGKSKERTDEKIAVETERAKNAEETLDSKKIDKTTVATTSTLGLVKSGTDITVDSSGNVSVKDNSHKHTVSNISDLTATASELNVLDGITSTTTELNKLHGTTATVDDFNKLHDVTASASELNIMDGVTATTTELNYVDGVTSNIQTQLNSKQPNITGGATTITSSNLTASRALISNSSGKVAVSDVTSTELGYLDGATSNIQTQLNAKAPLASPTLTGTPKAPTATAGTNTTQIATTAFVTTAVANGIAASDAMIVKGTIGTSGTVTSLPTTYKTGWTYRVVTAGTYAGQVCEIGDLIVALVDRSGSGNVDSDWCVAQTNINGAITGIKSGDAYITTSQSGSVVTITHKDVTRTNTTSTASPSHGGTFTAVKTVTSDAKGHVTGVDTETVTLPKAYTHPSYTARTGVPTANQTPAFGGTFSVSQPVSDATGHITAVNSRTITIPSAVATTSSAGLESAADKTKLDGIATGAEVNQNAFSNVVVGSTTISADSKTDSLTLAGSNVTITPDATNDKVTIGITKANVTSALGYTPPTTNTTYGVATTSENGLMSSTDKAKLDSTNVAYGTCSTAASTAAKTVDLDDTTSFSLVNGASIKVKFTKGNSVNSPTLNINSTGAKYIKYAGNTLPSSYIKANCIYEFVYDSSSDSYIFNGDFKETYTNATTSANGLMSSADKAKLDGIADSADAVSVTQKLTSGTEIGTVTINGTGTKLYAPTNTDTHYTSKNVVGSSTATSNTTSALTNGNVYLNSVENGSVTSSHKISGSGATTVTTDASGNIVISSTDNNTKNTAGSTDSSSKLFLIGATSQAANPQTYSHDTAYVGTDGCLYSGGSKVLTSHPTISASTDTTSTASPSHGGTVTMVDSITRDSNGHVTKINTKTITLPSDNNTDTKVTQTIKSDNKEYPLLLAPTGQTATATTTACFDSGVTLNPSTNTITANIIGSSTVANNALQLNGKSLLTKNAKDTWDAIPYIDDAGVMEIGKYIDFHSTDGNTADYDARITATETGLTLSGKTNLSIATPLKIVDDAGVSKSVISVLNPTPDSPSTYGSEVVMGGGGNVFIGAGESYTTIRNGIKSAIEAGTSTLPDESLYSASSEQMYVSSDSHLWLYSNANSYANRKALIFNTNGEFIPFVDNSYTLGKTNFAWKTIYANTFNSALETSTWLAGNQGNALVNSTASAGAYTVLSKLNSTNGYFCDAVFGKNRYLIYTSKETVDAGENSATYKAVLLTEDGDTLLPGLLTTYGGIKTTTVNGYLLADACAKGVLNNTTKGALGYVASTAQTLVPTVATIAFWDGAYTSSGASNLLYCSKGAFGDAAIKDVDTTPTKDSKNLITSGGTYTALAKYLPLTGGTMTGAITPATAVTYDLGSATLPWRYNYSKGFEIYGAASKNYGCLRAYTVGTTTTTGETRLVLGNNVASGNDNNACGTIFAFGNGTYCTKLVFGTQTANRTITFPNATGTVMLTSAISSSLASTSTTNVLSSAGAKDLQDQITALNSDLTKNYIQTGRVLNDEIGDCAANSSVTISITFQTEYSVTPKVFTQITTASTDVGYGNVSIIVDSISTTGFKARIVNNHTGTLAPYFLWVAIGDMS